LPRLSLRPGGNTHCKERRNILGSGHRIKVWGVRLSRTRPSRRHASASPPAPFQLTRRGRIGEGQRPQTLSDRSLSSCPPHCGVHTELHSTYSTPFIQLHAPAAPPPGGASWHCIPRSAPRRLAAGEPPRPRKEAPAEPLEAASMKPATDSTANTLLAIVHQRDRGRDRDRGTERDREVQRGPDSGRQRESL